MFASPGLHGYSVKFSPYYPNKLACVACQHYGIEGSSKLFILELPPDSNQPIRPNAVYDWADGLFDVAWSEKGDSVCVTAGGDGSIQIWDLINLKGPITVLKDHQKEVYSVDCSPAHGQNLIVSGSWDQTAKIWDPISKDLRPVTTFCGHSGIVYSTVWSPHMPGCFSSSSGDGTLRVWDIRKAYMPQTVITGHTAEILTCDWSKYDQNIIATGSVDCSIRVWDLRQPRLPIKHMNGHEYAVRRIRFSPHDAGVIGSCSYDFTVRTWNFMAPEQPNNALETIQHHTEFVYGLDFNIHVQGMIADCAWDEKTMVYSPKSLLKK